MKKQRIRVVLGTMAVIVAIISRIMFDGIFLRICYGESYIEVFAVVVLITLIVFGMPLMRRDMPMPLKFMGVLLLGIGAGGAMVNAVETICVFLNMNNSAVNGCQWLAFLLIFMLSGALGARESK